MDEFVLRAAGPGPALKLRYGHDKRLEIEGVLGNVGELRILRREPGGLVVALWGERVVSGVYSPSGETFILTLTGAEAGRHVGLTLKPAAIDALEQAVADAIGAHGPIAVHSPIPGLIKKVNVKPGDAVAAGQTVVVLEAMKMENEITAPYAGKVQSVEAVAGQTVGAGIVLMVLQVD